MDRWTLRTFLKPTVRTTRDVNVREAELRISHSLALMPPMAAAMPAWHASILRCFLPTKVHAMISWYSVIEA